jgi:hypothetical protein
LLKQVKNLTIESLCLLVVLFEIFILQRDFKKDIDIVAVGSGIELALKVSELLPKKPKVQVFKNVWNSYAAV